MITDAALTFGFETLTSGKPAFINVPRRLLVEGLPKTLSPKHVVIELLESIEADDEVLEACRKLRAAGFAIALDDFQLDARTEALVPLADYIKIDFLLAADPRARQSLLDLRKYMPQVAFLAEKVETVEQYETALGEGFEYFQGFFFGRPVTQGARTIPQHRIGYLRLLRALQDPDLTVDKLEKLIQHDPSLCYRVLRAVNSAAYGQQKQVASIRQAIVLIGVGVIQRWLSLWALAGIGADAHPELLVMSTIRARCCETLAARLHGEAAAPEGFLLGLCSMLDVILQQPVSTFLPHLSLSPAMEAALGGTDNQARRLLDCAIACERGEWAAGVGRAGSAGLDGTELAAAYNEALRWSTTFQSLE